MNERWPVSQHIHERLPHTFPSSSCPKEKSQFNILFPRRVLAHMKRINKYAMTFHLSTRTKNCSIPANFGQFQLRLILASEVSEYMEIKPGLPELNYLKEIPLQWKWNCSQTKKQAEICTVILCSRKIIQSWPVYFTLPPPPQPNQSG